MKYLLLVNCFSLISLLFLCNKIRATVINTMIDMGINRNPFLYFLDTHSKVICSKPTFISALASLKTKTPRFFKAGSFIEF